MAQINDPTTAIAAKVSSAGALLTTEGPDGFPSFITRFGSVRLTAIAAVNTYVWAMRAPATRTIELRRARLRYSHDPTTAAATTSIIDFIRFSGADPAGGTLLVPSAKVTADGTAQTIAVREAAAGTFVTLTGATVANVASSFGTLACPNSVGASADLALDEIHGFMLAPGEGLAIRVVAALPIGSVISGYVEFSERV